MHLRVILKGLFLLHIRPPQYKISSSDSSLILAAIVQLRGAPALCGTPPGMKSVAVWVMKRGLHRKDRRKAMDESITAENKKQSRQKPPLSRRRIAGEILAGTATGFAIAVTVLYVTGIRLVGGRDYTGSVGQLAAVGLLVTSIFVSAMVYGLASALGVYIVGSRGKQTGSFLATLGCGFLGGPVMLGMLYPALFLWHALIMGVEKVIVWAFCVLVLLTPPIMAALGFNLTRRYKRPVLPGSSSGKYFVPSP